MARYRPDPLFFPEELHVVQRPQKTFIGRIAHGFDFMGYWFAALGLEIPLKTVEPSAEKVPWFDERGAASSRIGSYLGRWIAWVRVGGNWSGFGSAVNSATFGGTTPRYN